MEQRCDFHWRTSGHQLAKGATATSGKRKRPVGWDSFFFSFFLFPLPLFTGVEWSPEELDGSARAWRSGSPAGPLFNSISTSCNEGNDAFEPGPQAWSISVMILLLLSLLLLLPPSSLLLCLKFCSEDLMTGFDYRWIFAEVNLTLSLSIFLIDYFLLINDLIYRPSFTFSWLLVVHHLMADVEMIRFWS